MAIKTLPTPMINAIIPFDPKYNNEINFVYAGEQHNRIRAVIVDNLTGQTVVDETRIMGGTTYTIYKDILEPGNQYLIQIQVLYISETGTVEKQSSLSDPVLFYCFSTPTFSFNEIVDGSEYNGSDITLSLNYFQKENEPIKSFQFLQYDINGSLINSSNISYSTTSMSYSFYKMNNDGYYSFRAIGETVHGMPLDTGYIQIHVNYETIPPNNVTLLLENNYCNGYISISTNIKVIGHEAENGNYSLEDDVLIISDDNSITYNDGFLAENDFTIYIEAVKLPVKKFFSTKDDIFSLSIINVCEDYYCKFNVKNTDYNQCILIPDAIYENEHIYISGKSMIFEIKRYGEYYYFNISYKDL